MDNQGQPVWFKPVPTNVLANNLTTQTYNGKPALSWWQGVVNNQGAILSGEDIVVDQHYRTVATLGAVDGWVPALHEFVVSGHNAWAIVSKNIPTDFTAQGGPAHGVLIDTAVAEFDLTTHKMVQLWDPVGHVPLTDSFGRPNPATGVWDAYHTNSVKLVAGNKLLVGMRNTWAGYLIDLPSGKIEWKLGGKPLAGTANFTIPTNAQFQWQHDIQLHSGNIATVFDDHCCAIIGPGKFAPPTGPSRALQLRLNMTTHTASLAAQIVRGAKFNAAFLGSNQLLANGNMLVSWGSQPLFSEYDQQGQAAARRRVAEPGPQLPRVPRALDRVAELPAGRRGPQEARQLDGVRELERSHTGRRLAGAGRPQRQPSEDGGTALADRF